MLLAVLLGVFFTYLNNRQKKKFAAQQETMKMQQRLDALIKRIDERIKQAEASKKFNPILINVIDELRAFNYESALAPSVEVETLERAEAELDKKVEAALLRAEFVSKASVIVSGMPKTILEMQRNASEVKREYEAMLIACKGLIDTVPGFTLIEETDKHVENIKGLYIDLQNAIDLYDVSKFEPIKASIISAQRKYNNVVQLHRKTISSIVDRIRYVNTFLGTYVHKIEEGLIKVQLDGVSHASRMSYENLVPHMRSMLQQFANTKDFTTKQIMCKEIETTYNFAIADFTKDLAEHSLKHAVEEAQDQD